MRLFGSSPPRKVHCLSAEDASHQKRLEKAIRRSASTNVQMLEVTTSRSLDQIEASQHIIDRVRSVVDRIQDGALNTSEEAMSLISRRNDDNHH